MPGIVFHFTVVYNAVVMFNEYRARAVMPVSNDFYDDSVRASHDKVLVFAPKIHTNVIAGAILPRRQKPSRGPAVVFSGVVFATGFTIFVVPVFYAALAKRTQLPGAVAQRLALEEGRVPDLSRA